MDINSNLPSLSEIDEILATLLFGSKARGKTLTRDTDLCAIAPESKDRAALLLKIFSKVHKPEYDIWIFEELPLYMKVEIIRDHKVIFCRDYIKLYEYFSKIMAIWRDQEIRIKTYSKLL